MTFALYQQPVNRESVRLDNEKMRMCQQTVHTWLRKGNVLLGRLLPDLKSVLLTKHTLLNCDET